MKCMVNSTDGSLHELTESNTFEWCLSNQSDAAVILYVCYKIVMPSAVDGA